MDATTEFLPRASTGVAGLDQVLDGGWARTRMHLLEGSPGTGKTTIALQFLLAGAKAGETGIYISLAETEQELRDGARSHGWEIPKQVEIFEHVVRSTGRIPAVVDTVDLLASPPGLLARLCAHVGIPFTSRMLEWPTGPRASDGVWARHWYDRVERTTHFEPVDSPQTAETPLPADLARLEAACRPLYENLRAHRLRA